MTTLKDIATAVGVDVSTVSKVVHGAKIRVSEAKREEILKVAKQLDYRPNAVARGLRLRKSGAIAVPVPSTTNYIYPEIISGAEDAADKLGFVLFLVKHSIADPAAKLLSLVEQGRIDGLLFAEDLRDEEVLTTLRERQVPFVTLNRIGTDHDRYVCLNDEQGFAFQAEYLLGLGHKRVAFVSVEPDSYTSRCCVQAFSKPFSDGQVEVLPCDFQGDRCLELADQILALNTTAVATASVLVASRLVEIFRSRGISVPGQISVIGYHDSPLASWPPPGVTTVKLPSREQGYRAVEALVDLVEGRPCLGETVMIAPTIIDRNTCRAV